MNIEYMHVYLKYTYIWMLEFVFSSFYIKYEKLLTEENVSFRKF